MNFSLVPAAILVITTVQASRVPPPKKALQAYLDALLVDRRVSESLGKPVVKPSDQMDTTPEYSDDHLVWAWLRYHEHRLLNSDYDEQVSSNIALLKKRRQEFEASHNITQVVDQRRHKKTIYDAVKKFREEMNNYIVEQEKQYKGRPDNMLYESSVRDLTLTWFRRCQRHAVDGVKCSGFCCLPSNTQSVQLSCDVCGLLNDLGKTWNDITVGANGYKSDAINALNSILNYVEITAPESNEDGYQHKPNEKLATIEEFGGLPDGYDGETEIVDDIVIPQRKKVAGQKTEEVKQNRAPETCQAQKLCKTVSQWCKSDKLVSNTEEAAKGLGAVRINAQITDGEFSGRFKQMLQAMAEQEKKQKDDSKQMGTDADVSVDDVLYEDQPESSLES